VQERYEYDPYGNPIILDDDWNPRAYSLFQWNLHYAGYPLELLSGLYQVRERFFHGQLGYWTIRDSIEYIDGMNLYAYVGGNPTTRQDPTGLTWHFTEKAAAPVEVPVPPGIKSSELGGAEVNSRTWHFISFAYTTIRQERKCRLSIAGSLKPEYWINRRWLSGQREIDIVIKEEKEDIGIFVKYWDDFARGVVSWKWATEKDFCCEALEYASKLLMAGDKTNYWLAAIHMYHKDFARRRAAGEPRSVIAIYRQWQTNAINRCNRYKGEYLDARRLLDKWLKSKGKAGLPPANLPTCS